MSKGLTRKLVLAAALAAVALYGLVKLDQWYARRQAEPAEVRP